MKFKASELWDAISENDVFAVKFPDGRIGYCIVMGMYEMHRSIAVYIGDEGISSLWQVMQYPGEGDYSPDSSFLLHSADCLQCELLPLYELSDQEARQPVRYLESIGETLTPSVIVPNLCSYRPRRLPYPVSRQEEEDLCFALSAALYASQHLEMFHSRREYFPWNEEIPLLSKNGRTWQVGTTYLPMYDEFAYLEPKLPDAALIDYINRQKTAVFMTLDVSLTILKAQIVKNPDSKDPAPVFAVALLAMDENYVLQPSISPAMTDEQIDEMLSTFAEVIADLPEKPGRIRVNGTFAYVFLEEFCAVTGIELVYDPSIPRLEELTDNLNRTLDEPDEEFNRLMDLIARSPDADEIMHTLDQAVQDGEAFQYIDKLKERFLKSEK